MSASKRTAESANTVDIDDDGVRRPKRRRFNVNAELIAEEGECKLHINFTMKIFLTFN